MTAATPAAHWDAAQQKRALFAWALRNSGAAFAAQGFLIYYLLELGAGDRLLGWAMALPSLTYVAQFFGSMWSERTASRRQLCIRLFLCHAFSWVPALAVGAWAAGQPERYPIALWVFVVCLGLIALFFQFHSPAWDSWFSDAVPDDQKSAFFGRWGMCAGFGGMGALLLSGWLVEGVARGQPTRIFQWMLLAVFAIGVAFTLGSAWLYTRLQDVRAEHQNDSVRELVRQALGQRNYMNLILTCAWQALAAGLYAPFMIVWFREDLKMGILFLSLLLAVNQAMLALASPLWSRLVTRFGGKPVLAMGLIFGTLECLTYFFYTPGNFHWLALIHWGASGFLMASYSVASNTLWYALPQRQGRAMQFAIAWTVFGIGGGLGAIGGGWLASHFSPMVIQSHQWSHYHWLLPIGIVLHLPCFYYLYKLQEQGAREPRVMVAWLIQRFMLRRSASR